MAKQKVILIVAVATVVVLAVCSALIIPGMLRKGKYDTATRLLESGAYSQSVVVWAELGNYQDSEMNLQYALMQEALDNAAYETALSHAGNLAAFRDAETYAAYAKGMLALDAEDYDEAAKCLAEAGSVRDAQKSLALAGEKREERRYAEAEGYRIKGEWLAAHALYLEMPEYKDSATLAGECYGN